MPLSDSIARMAHARAVMRKRYVADARDQFARLGIAPSPDQLEAAGDRLLKEAQRERMAVARATRWTARADERRAADVSWATEQAHRYADRVRALDPTMADGDVFRVCLMAVADELAAPDAFSRPRLVRRLDAYLASVKERGSAGSSTTG